MAKILVVEDESELANIIAEHLRSEGHLVILESNGSKALERAGLEAFDLLILDLMLPGLDGLEVARRLRRSSGATTATVPILMLTARAEETDRVLGFEVGADDYIV